VGGIILGTPVYMGGPTTLGKAFLDRWTVFRKNHFALRNKVGACIAVGGSRNGGQELAVVSVLVAMMYQEMVLVGSGQPCVHYGAAVLNDGKDSVAGDEVGLGMARAVGKRVAEVVMRLKRD
jgi:multimeric flavodoxin WrbA